MNNIFFHIAKMGQYASIINDILYKLKSSNLYENAKMCFCYNGEDEIAINDNNIKVIKNTNMLAAGEFPTLERIRQFSKNHPNEKILYIHTKGVSTPENACINDWRDYMLYFTVEKWKDCIETLESYDTCGVDLRTEPSLHYSGNFWWANTNHIALLPEFFEMPLILSERHKGEFWVCSKGQHHKSLWDCGINCYERHLHRYPKEKYVS